MKRVVRTIDGKEITLEIKESLPWSQMKLCLKGLLNVNERGKVSFDMIDIAERAMKYLVSHNGKEVNGDIIDGSDILTVLSNDVMPILFRQQKTDRENTAESG